MTTKICKIAKTKTQNCSNVKSNYISNTQKSSIKMQNDDRDVKKLKLRQNSDIKRQNSPKN